MFQIGSFQVFVSGYKDAVQWLQHFESEPLSPDIALEFQLEFERLVILDYVIRNTDRGHENWLIRYEGSAGNRNSQDIEIAMSPVNQVISLVCETSIIAIYPMSDSYDLLVCIRFLGRKKENKNKNCGD